ncbi:MAG: hypothetical protein AAF202_06495 [Pseudomonadota bacterium]
MKKSLLSRIQVAFAVAAIIGLVACASQPKPTAADPEANRDFQSEVDVTEADLEKEIEASNILEDEEFAELERDLSNTDPNQLKRDIAEITDQIIETEQELDDAQSLLSKMIKKNLPANQIETQKGKVVVLEDQLFDLNDEKTLKEIEAEVTR